MHAPPSLAAARIRIHVNPLTGCWEWIGSRNDDGYGVVSVAGRQQSAHRAVWTLLVGPIGDGMTLDHVCRLRACVNPTHLEEVTGGENLSRMHAARKNCLPRSLRQPPPVRHPRPAPPPSEGQTLADVCAVMGGRERMHSVDIVAALADHDAGRYGAWTAKTLARTLRPHGLTAIQLWMNGQNRMGFRLSAVAAALTQWVESSSNGAA